MSMLPTAIMNPSIRKLIKRTQAGQITWAPHPDKPHSAFCWDEGARWELVYDRCPGGVLLAMSYPVRRGDLRASIDQATVSRGTARLLAGLYEAVTGG